MNWNQVVFKFRNRSDPYQKGISECINQNVVSTWRNFHGINVIQDQVQEWFGFSCHFFRTLTRQRWLRSFFCLSCCLILNDLLAFLLFFKLLLYSFFIAIIWVRHFKWACDPLKAYVIDVKFEVLWIIADNMHHWIVSWEQNAMASFFLMLNEKLNRLKMEQIEVWPSKNTSRLQRTTRLIQGVYLCARDIKLIQIEMFSLNKYYFVMHLFEFDVHDFFIDYLTRERYKP